MKNPITAFFLLICLLTAATMLHADTFFYTGAADGDIASAANWNNGSGPSPADSASAEHSFILDGGQMKTANGVDVTTYGKLILQNEATFMPLSSASTTAVRTFTFPGFTLNRSTISSDSAGNSSGKTVSWVYKLPIEFSDECVLVRNSGIEQIFTFNGAFSGDGLFAFQSNSSYAMTININATGSYEGIFSLERLGSTGTCTFNLDANPGPLTRFQIQSVTDQCTRRSELCTGGAWSINAAANALDGTQHLLMKRSGSTLTLNGNQSIGTLEASAGTLTASADTVLTVNQSANATFSGAITGPISLKKQGPATLTFSPSTNSATGSLTIEEGTFSASNTLAFSGGVTVAGGTLDASASNTITTGTLALNSGSLRLNPIIGTAAVNVTSLSTTGTDDFIFTFASPLSVGIYTLVSSASAMTLAEDLTNFKTENIATDFVATFELSADAKTLSLVLDPAADIRELVWNGISGDVWSTEATAASWLNGSAPSSFNNLDTVSFGTTASPLTVKVTEEVRPGAMTFQESEAAYIFETEDDAGNIQIASLTAEAGSKAIFNLPATVITSLVTEEGSSLAFNGAHTLPAAITAIPADATLSFANPLTTGALTFGAGSTLTLGKTFGNSNASTQTSAITFGADSALNIGPFAETATQTIGVNMSGAGIITARGENTTLSLTTTQTSFTGQVRVTDKATFKCKSSNEQNGVFYNNIWASAIPIYVEGATLELNGGPTTGGNPTGWNTNAGHNFAELGENATLKLVCADGFCRVITLSGPANIIASGASAEFRLKGGSGFTALANAGETIMKTENSAPPFKLYNGWDYANRVTFNTAENSAIRIKAPILTNGTLSTGGILKIGVGHLIFEGDITTTSNIEIYGGTAMLNASATAAGPWIVGEAGDTTAACLAGNGSIAGKVTVNASGAIETGLTVSKLTLADGATIRLGEDLDASLAVTAELAATGTIAVDISAIDLTDEKGKICDVLTWPAGAEPAADFVLSEPGFVLRRESEKLVLYRLSGVLVSFL